MVKSGSLLNYYVRLIWYITGSNPVFSKYKLKMSFINQGWTFSVVSSNIFKFVLLTINKIKNFSFINLKRINTNYLFNLLDNHVIHYGSPLTLTYAWSFGSLAGFCLIIQIISGICLAMHYTPNVDLAFNSIEYIMRDVKNGYLIWYIHANGASMFFIVVYLHIAWGLYYGSYTAPKAFLWCSGVLILLLMMLVGFTGYVLPWGQMSFWGATVITNMATAIPIAGKYIVQWLWGGFTVDNPTLNWFFSIHFAFPFVIAAISLIHLALLHKKGSTNPLGSEQGIDDVPFYPYFFSKDLFAFVFFLVFFTIFVFYLPNLLNHPDNYICADPLETPAHVVPEWYFLAFYAILRSIPSKTGGILAMGGSILILFVIPFINTSDIWNTSFRPIFKICFWLFIADFVLLTWVGQKPVTTIFILLGQIATFYYFLFFLILIPAVGIIESKLVHYKT